MPTHTDTQMQTHIYTQTNTHTHTHTHTPHHTRQYSTKLIIEAMNKNGHDLKVILACGGLSHNFLYRQMHSDITGECKHSHTRTCRCTCVQTCYSTHALSGVCKLVYFSNESTTVHNPRRSIRHCIHDMTLLACFVLKYQASFFFTAHTVSC